jgi:hypothetical protein
VAEPKQTVVQMLDSEKPVVRWHLTHRRETFEVFDLVTGTGTITGFCLNVKQRGQRRTEERIVSLMRRAQKKVKRGF